ncbi:Uncharacterized membrane protein [Thiohalospira halophila DSM 15071]|uniref:Uncharacterized membrane protein n=1 Tax=Thiohalospira halophila DSM 15071 TaxID=1123397 RepID=A0A1I1QK77_9GAMM|nr:DUF502 domain-containing protein [Thiohalospira halophila]SFD22534.1 Uncharacterized membrane protein [Thiohalospira halophila DSM 15071]
MPPMHLQRYLITGLLTIIPLWLTWWVFDFVLGQLSSLGGPLVRALAGLVEPWAPGLSARLLAPWFEFGLAVVATLLALYILGWLTTRVVGRRLIALVDAIIDRIPLVQRVYGATRQLLAALQTRPSEDVERVVLIDFPSPEMKAVGFVTRVFTDPDDGQRYAAVYVPTTPNPTSGYLEIVPVEKMVTTGWSADEAMSFIISGGTVGPDELRYRAAPPAPSPEE